MTRVAKCRCQDPTAVAILARISDKEKQGQPSLEAQIRETRERLVTPKGWRVVVEYPVKHRGSDLSGDPVYMRMITDARAGLFSRLCLHKFDRFARRSYDREVFEHILTKECGVELHAALEPYDLKTRAGQLTKKTSAFISDIFLDNLREESLKGMTQKAASGGWPARAPIGYVNKREELAHNKFRRWVETDPVHRNAVELAFRLYATGEHTLDTLSAWLNDHGYLWLKGKPWRRDRLHRMLVNPFYAGMIHWNGTVAQGAHEELVDHETWEKCQQVLRLHDANRERRVRQVYPLSRILYFGDLGCGALCECHADRGDVRYYRSKDVGPAGSQVYLRAEQVEDLVGESLRSLTLPEVLRAEVGRTHPDEAGRRKSPGRMEADRLALRLKDLEEENRGYVRLAAQGSISDEEFAEERARVQAAIEAVREKIEAIRLTDEKRYSDVDLALELLAHLPEVWKGAGLALRKRLALLLFKRVSVSSEGEILSYELTETVRWLGQQGEGHSVRKGSGIGQV